MAKSHKIINLATLESHSSQVRRSGVLTFKSHAAKNRRIECQSIVRVCQVYNILQINGI